MMGFVAIDVETANPDMVSICQIGLARYKDGLLTEEWKSYIDPQDYFDDINVSIHGIDKSTVRGAPVFAQVSLTPDVNSGHQTFSHAATCLA
jgi:DNA polymerase-3 subunit epsilon